MLHFLDCWKVILHNGNEIVFIIVIVLTQKYGPFSSSHPSGGIGVLTGVRLLTIVAMLSIMLIIVWSPLTPSLP